MERIRNQIANDPGLYPEFKKPTNGKASGTPSVISISSTSTSSTSSAASTVAPPARHKGRTTIVISSDEENEDIPPATDSQTSAQAPAPTIPGTLLGNLMKQTFARAYPERVAVPAPIHIPSNRDILPGPSQPNPTWQYFDAPNEANLYDPRMSTAETEKALRALVEDSITHDDEVEINMDEAIVEGFKDGITLLPHQVLGRAWMRERESSKKTGGILADDMGLGKTIQTIARIVDGRAKKSDKADGWSATTLVVCPVALVSQWASEIQKMAVGLRVIEHHGQSRSTDPLKLKAAHVVVTSYSIVASEYATFAPDAKDESKSKSKSKSKKAASQSDSDSDSDDVVTKKKPGKAKGKDALFRVKWFRIVLDEAHNIKNRNTKAAIACCELEGKYRWCLTGTPMQNTVDELFSLIKFLRIPPLNDWQTFNDHIAKPVKAGKPVRAIKRLHVVLKTIMLRRTKNHVLNGKPIITLPARNVSVVQCKFDSDEHAFYKTLSQRMTTELDKLLQANEASKNYTHVLLMLLRLRQACNHPSLVNKDYRIDSDAAEPRPAKNDDADEDADELASLLGQMGVSNGKKCQLCQTDLTSSDEDHCPDCAQIAAKARRKSNVRDANLPPDSAKIRKMLDLLRDIDERSEGAEKTIIFSQFTSMLDLIEPFLTAEGIKYARYDGSMTKDKREASLEKIRNSSSTRCILISFKAGSTGLNLTCCNNVILVDMWWNPALEEQAFDRAHRFGQTRDVNIFKLTIPETVEERILELQEKKRELAKAALSGEKMKNMKLGMDDLLALFRPGGNHDDDEED